MQHVDATFHGFRLPGKHLYESKASFPCGSFRFIQPAIQTPQAVHRFCSPLPLSPTNTTPSSCPCVNHHSHRPPPSAPNHPLLHQPIPLPCPSARALAADA